MMSIVRILKNENVEMMKIFYKNDLVFEGNYWDFDRDPKSLVKFLKKLKVDVSLNDYLYDDQ